uniref:Uncharacterized protein n=1 Tax=Terrapene triunguis TaxID=2587831 RepID=A0A674ICR7_9SAUR
AAVESRELSSGLGSGQRPRVGTKVGNSKLGGGGRTQTDKILCQLVSPSLCLACPGFLAAQLFPTCVMLRRNKSVMLVPAGNPRRRTASGSSNLSASTARLSARGLTEIMGYMKGKLMHHNTQLMEALKPPHKYMPESVRDGKDMDMYKEEKPTVCEDKGLSPAVPKTESA